MELIVGKKVRVRSDLVADKYYDDLYMNEYMMQFCGNIYTIKEMVRPDKYSLSDIPHWTWNDKMLEEIYETLTFDNITIGMKVIPISKSYGIQLSESAAFRKYKKQGYLYVTKICEDHICCSSTIDAIGENFLPSDLILYEERTKEEENYIILNDNVRVGDYAMINITSPYACNGDIGMVVGFESENAIIGFNHTIGVRSNNWNKRFPNAKDKGYYLNKNDISRVCMNKETAIKMKLPLSIEEFL